MKKWLCLVFICLVSLMFMGCSSETERKENNVEKKEIMTNDYYFPYDVVLCNGWTSNPGEHEGDSKHENKCYVFDTKSNKTLIIETEGKPSYKEYNYEGSVKGRSWVENITFTDNNKNKFTKNLYDLKTDNDSIKKAVDYLKQTDYPLERKKIMVDYIDAKTFEKDVNDNKSMKDKLVKIEIKDLKTDSLLGCDVSAGEHLNFAIGKNCSTLPIKKGESIVVKIEEEPKKEMNSWVIDASIYKIF